MREEQKEREAALWEIFNAKYAQQQITISDFIGNLEKEKDESKVREAALWSIFKTKFTEQEQSFEEYMQSMADDRNNTARTDQIFKKEIIEEQEKTAQALLRMESAVERMEEEKKKVEEARKQLEKSYEELMIEAKKRPEAEAEMFKRLTRKLDAERKLLATERQKMESERMKLVESDEKRKRKEEKRSLEWEREKLDNDRKQLGEKNRAEIDMFKVENDAENKAQKAQKAQGRQGVAEWLAQNGLSEYYQKFIDCGYESLEVCALIDDNELVAIDIAKPGHRKALINACQLLRENVSVTSRMGVKDDRNKKWKEDEWPKKVVEKENPEEKLAENGLSYFFIYYTLYSVLHSADQRALPTPGKNEIPSSKVPIPIPPKQNQQTPTSKTQKPKQVASSPQVDFSQDTDSTSDTIFRYASTLGGGKSLVSWVHYPVGRSAPVLLPLLPCWDSFLVFELMLDTVRVKRIFLQINKFTNTPCKTKHCILMF